MYCPVINPHNSNDVWCVVDMGAVFHSVDSGVSWEMIDDENLVSTVKSDMQFTSDPDIMYFLNKSLDIISTQLFRGVLAKSIDGGNTWNNIPDPTSSGIQNLIVDPNSAGRILLAEYDRLYFSNDGANSWQMIYYPGGLVWLAGAFWDGDDIFVGTGDGLLVSHNGGISFDIENLDGLPSGHGIARFAAAKENGTIRFFALSCQKSLLEPWIVPNKIYDDMGDLYSIDYGQSSWTDIQSNLGSTNKGIWVAVSPDDIDIVWIAAKRNGLPRILKSINGGNSWSHTFFTAGNQNIATGWQGEYGHIEFFSGPYFNGLTIDKNNPDRILAINNFLYSSSNEGTTWEALNVQPQTRHNIGQPSNQIEYFSSSGIDVTASNYILFLSENTEYVAGIDIGAQYSDDGGLSWTLRRNIFPSWGYNWGPLQSPNWYTILKNPDQNILYAATGQVNDLYYPERISDDINGSQGMVIRSFNEGIDWDTLKLFGNPVPWLTLDKNNPDVLLASVYNNSSGGIYKSVDAGNTWNHLPNPPRTEGHPYITHILDDGSIVASYSARLNNGSLTQSSGIFYSPDGGQTWNDRSDPGMIYYTQDVIIDPNDPDQNTWYASVWGRYSTWPPSNSATVGVGGVYKTIDRGLTWIKIFENERTIGMAIDPQDPNTIYVASNWSGLYKSTNINSASPLFEKIEEFPFARPKRIFFNDFVPNEMWITTQGGGLFKTTLALPLDLISFKGYNQNCNNYLNWETYGANINHSYFVVEYSSDGVNYIELEKIYNANSIVNNNIYQFIHTNVKQKNNYYRLKQFDHDCKYEYSNVVEVTNKCFEENHCLFPNPFTDFIYIDLNCNKNIDKILLYDSKGSLIILIENSNLFAEKIKLDLSYLSQGFYFIKLIDKNKNTLISQKIIKAD